MVTSRLQYNRGSIVGWGNNDYGQASPPAGNDFIAIAAGGMHSVLPLNLMAVLSAGATMIMVRRRRLPETTFVAIAAGGITQSCPEI